jgi:hypothetical protein
MKLYTVVVHYLQMCMKEYRCCLKFRKIIFEEKDIRGINNSAD